MPLHDSEALRQFVALVFPGILFDGVPAPSGQRVVYFCRFNAELADDPSWVDWGNVVVKVSEGVTAQGIAYIQREIEILNSLPSRNYPRLLHNEVVTTDPITEERLQYARFITIEERIDAKPLSEFMRAYSSERAVLGLLNSLVLALRALWEAKPPLIHRDIKPANILIGEDGHVTVIDLAIARIEGSEGVTYTAADYGPCTPQYACPEQAKNKKEQISYRSDFFALGILCYELLSGQNPFLEESGFIDAVLHRVCTYAPPTLAELGVCSERTSSLISKLMEKEPYRRHRKIDDLLADIAQIQETNGWI